MIIKNKKLLPIIFASCFMVTTVFTTNSCNSFWTKNETLSNDKIDVENEINKLKLNPITINDEGKNVLVENIDIDNINNYLDNFPVNNSGVIITIEKLYKEKTSIILEIKLSKNNYYQIYNQKIDGFKIPESKPEMDKVIFSNPLEIVTPSVGNINKEYWIENKKYEMNGFSKSITKIEKELKSNGNKNINIFYNLGYFAVLHKYGIIAHLLKVAEFTKQHQNLNIKLMINENIPGLKPNNFDFGQLKQKYPKIEINFKSSYLSNNVDLKNDINYLIIDDISFLNVDDNYNNLDKLLTAYIPLLNFREINVIADGTASTASYQNVIYNFYRDNKYLQFDRTQKIFHHAVKLIQEMMINYQNNYLDYIEQHIRRIGFKTFLRSFISCKCF